MEMDEALAANHAAYGKVLGIFLGGARKPIIKIRLRFKSI